MTAKPARRLHAHAEPLPTRFGQLITADHMVMGPTDAGLRGERTALVVLDRGTGWLSCYPLPDKTSEAALAALQDFVGNTAVERFYSDNAPELVSAAQALGWTRERATPGRPQTNRVAERAVRSVLDGTRSALLSAGLPESFWPLACKHWCFARNTQRGTDGACAWNLRFNGEFPGKRPH